MKLKLILITFFCATALIAQKKKKSNLRPEFNDKKAKTVKGSKKGNNKISSVADFEKLIQLKKYDQAVASIGGLEKKVANVKGLVPIQFQYLKGVALAKSAKGNIATLKSAINALNKADALQKDIKAFKYQKDIKKEMSFTESAINEVAYSEMNAKNYSKAIESFEYLYKNNPKDTISLYNAAAGYLNTKQYDSALQAYEKLNKIGFTGIKNQYSATNVKTGKVQIIANKKVLDKLVEKGTYSNPKVEKLPSKRPNITKNIALIYAQQGNTAKVEEILSSAENTGIANNPQLKSIAINTYFNNAIKAVNAGDKEKGKLLYNKVLKIEPNHPEANLNMASILLSADTGFVTKMNALGNTRDEVKQFNQLQEQRLENYRNVAPYLEKYLEAHPENTTTASTLLTIYQNTKNPKAAALKAKLGK